MKKHELKVDVIYHLKKMLEGLKVCVIESNRNNPTKNKKMMEGCISEGMQQPGIFAEAKLAMEAGYKLKDVEDNHVISADEVADYLVITDGNTRFHAYMLSQKDNKGKKFEYKFHLMTYADAASFRTAYLKMNIYNNPTKVEDFARDVMATSNHPVLVSYRAKINMGLTPKAAGFATIGREIVKQDLINLLEGKEPAIFDDGENLNRYYDVYANMHDLLDADIKVFKGSEVWKFNASKINDAEDKALMRDRLIKMYCTMPVKTFGKLQKAKANGALSKEAVVSNILEEALNLV